VWFVLLLVAAGVAAAVIPMLPSSWPLAVRALLGVVGVVMAGAAGSYVSEVIAARRKILEDQRAAVAEVAARRDALVATRELTASDQSVAGLLRPERAVVQFAGRQEELRRLLAWCADEAACPVWLVTGRGGVGKTRLGLHLAESLPFDEWECQTVKPGDEIAAVKAAGEVGQRVLLLVDYAETRPELAAMLTEVAKREAAGDARALRVLLLARQAGEWWTSPDTESDATRALAARAPMLELAAALDDQRDDVQVIEDALPFYAAALGRPVPQVTFTVESSARLPVLVLHAAALVAALDDEQGTSGGRAAADLGVLDRLLGHERRLWDKTARKAGLTVQPSVLEQVIATAVLLLDPQERGEAAVREVIRRVPDLADADGERVGALTRWLQQLYPAEGGGVDTLRPDLLAERHATNQLTKHDLLRRACFTELALPQAIQALTVLTRACAHHQRAPGLIEQVLGQDLAGLADAAIVVAVQTGTRLGDLLAGVLEDVPARVEDLQHIAEKIPYPTVALAAAHVAATRRVRELLPAGAAPVDIARWSGKLATVLAQLGRREEALEAVTQAVAVYRTLAEARPEAFLPDLAASLNNQSNRLSDLGRREEALEAITEAVVVYRTLAEARPEAFLPDLAASLNNQSNCLSDLGRWEEALEAITQAVQIRRTLAEARPEAFLPHLATSLVVMGMVLVDLDRIQDGTRYLIEGLTMATDRNLAELARTCAELLRQAHALNADAVTSTWRQTTGEDPPTWLQ
jgi:tetratricopeptide (TPR) repeat protein